MQAYNMQLYDLADIADELSKKGNPLRENLIEVMFVYRDARKEETWKQGDLFSSVHIRENTAKFPITLFVDNRPDHIAFRFEYSLAYFTEATMELLAGQFNQLLETIGMNIDLPLAEYINGFGQSRMVEDEKITFNF